MDKVFASVRGDFTLCDRIKVNDNRGKFEHLAWNKRIACLLRSIEINISHPYSDISHFYNYCAKHVIHGVRLLLYIIALDFNSISFIEKGTLQKTSKYSYSYYMIMTDLNLPSGSRQERLLLYPFNINYSVI